MFIYYLHNFRFVVDFITPYLSLEYREILQTLSNGNRLRRKASAASAGPADSVSDGRSGSISVDQGIQHLSGHIACRARAAAALLHHYGEGVGEVLIPQEAGKGYEFENKIVGGVIPKEYITPIDKGIQEAINSGVLAGYPVVDIKIELIDGSYHDVDSSEAAFKVAGSMAVKAALKKAAPVILEPMMAVEVETPEEYMGDVMGNLSSRRGQIQGMGDRGNAKTIKAKVPLSEMFGYATDLRSTTQGRASYTMQFDSYEAVPKNVAEEIISKAGGNA